MALYTILFGISIFMIAFVMAIIKRMFFHWKEDTKTERMLMTTIDRPACSLIIYSEKCVLRRKIFTGDINVYDVIDKDDLEFNKDFVPDILMPPDDMFVDYPLNNDVAQENVKDSHLTNEVRNKNVDPKISNNQPLIHRETDNEKVYEKVELKIKDLQRKIQEKVEQRHSKWELSEVETCNIDFKSDDRKQIESEKRSSEVSYEKRNKTENIKDFKDTNTVNNVHKKSENLDVEKALVCKDEKDSTELNSKTSKIKKE